MPATKIIFADYPKHPPPRKLYIDTNFACDLLAHEINAQNAAALKHREIQSMSFYGSLVADGVELVCSPFTFNEVLHQYCFRYPGGMDDLTTTFLKNQPGIQMPKGAERFKFFLRSYPTQCDTEWSKIKYRVGATEQLFDKYKIKIVHPLPSPQLTNITKNVCEFAAILKDYYVAIECTDAFHLAAASYLGTDGIVSHDTGFLAVDGVTIYCAA